MLFGVDTSGKMGQGNLYIAIAEHKSSDAMERLREKIGKRHRALASRRRIKASDLTKSEMEWLVGELHMKYYASCLSIATISKIRQKFLNSQDWRFKILGCVIYITSRTVVKKDDTILIDRDYSDDVMKKILKYTSILFENHSKDKVILETGTSYDEVIVAADLIAGFARNNCIEFETLSEKSIEPLMKILK